METEEHVAAPLIPEERHQELLRLLRRSGVLSIRTLTGLMGVSHMTVRRDIATLEEAGRVVAVQGGVRLAEEPGRPPRARAGRAALELPRKRAIAEHAASLVDDGMVVFLDAGTTCESVVAHLAGRSGVTVVTNDFGTVRALHGLSGIDAVHTGGAVDPDSDSASGPLAAATLGALAVDLCFLSTGSWDAGRGVTSHATDKVTLKRAAMAASGRRVLLADSTKYGTHERFRVAGLDELDLVVTDDELPAAAARRIEELGVGLHRVPAPAAG
ncbi:DeoR/GlpR family DNA-binding transcription regulator [Pseudonocardia sp. DR1-2]|uniref:DeoR/GlpR family DNA-binding transcription regulator n=1 Tax=Pseudonocardia sp. DR1-2 TaxID=2951168 RepID=UPI0020446FC6|nr:DeoR/GlpR family DNA-binding transcription regulator [Pseudonocardia sp. DR1-2]MCM3847163.1 DeoR/GlpR family DNA-binding transcription regulator [Pseudonocardia sp. DR1-2]